MIIRVEHLLNSVDVDAELGGLVTEKLRRRLVDVQGDDLGLVLVAAALGAGRGGRLRSGTAWTYPRQGIPSGGRGRA